MKELGNDRHIKEKKPVIIGSSSEGKLDLIKDARACTEAADHRVALSQQYIEIRIPATLSDSSSDC